MSSSPLTFELDPHHLPVNISIVKFIFESPKLGGILIIHLKMVIEGKNVELALHIENDEVNDRVAMTNLVDNRLEQPNHNSKSKEVVITTGEHSSSLAEEKRSDQGYIWK